VVTFALVALNVVFFLLSPVVASQGEAAPCRQAAFLDQYAAVPYELTHNQQLTRVPTGDVRAVHGQTIECATGKPGYEKSPFLSVLYAMFLHAGWLHLLGNMLFLWIFGNNVEDRFGRLRFLLFYLFCGYVAAYGFALADPNSTTPLLGASGAIAGVLGAYLIMFPRARVWVLVPFLFFIPLLLPAWFVLGGWFLLQWLYSAGHTGSDVGGVAYLAHVVGFIAGVVIALFVRAASPDPRRYSVDGRPTW
jgi:membrane associated rhomboid family serine protease